MFLPNQSKTFHTPGLFFRSRRVFTVPFQGNENPDAKGD